MTYTHPLKKLALAVSLLTGSQVAWSITPWQANDSNASNYGTPDYVIYASGGAAQDEAIVDVVKTTLAATGTLDIFKDATTTTQTAPSWGSNFTGYYFIGSSNLPANLVGKKIYFEKRSRGAAGYGVVPVLAGTAIDQLYIFNTPTANSATANTASYSNWTQNTVDGSWGQVVDTTTAGKASLVQHFSHGGFTGVDAQALVLNSSSKNYPAAVKEYSTNANTTPFAATWTPADLTSLVTRIPTGGLTYGIAVTTDLYKVLQAAQIASGKLPATTVIGDYSADASLPSLSRDFVASLLAGRVSDWDNVEVKVTSAGTTTAYPLTSTVFTGSTAANVTVPKIGSTTPVAVGIRNNGAAVGAAAYATFLNYPYAESAIAPANATPAALIASAHPFIAAATGVNNTGALLTDWQTGANKSTLNVNSAKYWGIAINNATSNDAVSNANWRYVKLDGYAPTIENVSSGSYPFWAEGEVLIANNTGSVGNTATLVPVSADITNFLTSFANDLGSIRVATAVNPSLAQPWGQPGIFATTASHPVSTTSGVALDIPFQANNPLVPLSHIGTDGYTHLGVRPVSTLKTNIIELK